LSAYQYYEFVAVDRPLDAAALTEVRRLSTRARITATSFVNEYHWATSAATRKADGQSTTCHPRQRHDAS
jgi:hypothetical protein